MSIKQIWENIRWTPRRLRHIEREIIRTRKLVQAHQRETQLILSYLTLPDASLWRNPTPIAGAPGHNIFPGGALCREDMFQQPYFHYWCSRIREPVRYHRKQWEFVFILQAAWERGLLESGHRALGFGVGTEPLSAVFAAHGMTVTATDMASSDIEAAGWQSTDQHASGKAALRRRGICSEDIFEQNVEFRTCDMNNVPDDLTGYDLCWSACALEHLGSIEKGLAFIERSLECLAPGGYAIHTTEYNISSNSDTIDNEITVLFRRRDIEDLVVRLQARGHEVTKIDWTVGTGSLDQYVDLPPYRSEPHLSSAILGYKCTSIGLIIRKAQ